MFGIRASRHSLTRFPHNIPNKIIGAWYWSYNAPSIATLLAASPAHNYLSYFAAIGDGSNTGAVSYNPATPNPPVVADVKAWKNSGRTIVLCVGGSVANGLVLLNATHATQMVASLKTLIGPATAPLYQGVDFDLEGGSAQWSPTYMASVASQLKSYYGSSFIIAMSPQPFEINTAAGIHAQAAALMGNNLDLVCPQFYGVTNTDSYYTNGFMLYDIPQMINLNIGVTDRKIVLGCSDPAAATGGAPTLAAYVGAYDAAIQTPFAYNLRGAMFWNSQEAASTSYAFATTVGGEITTPARSPTTNLMPNPSMAGAVPGTPGTPPTGWTLNFYNGLSSQVVGTGTENGLNYFDFRWFGVSTGTNTGAIIQSPLAPVVNGNSYTLYIPGRIVAGSTANMQFNEIITQQVNLFNSSSGFLTSIFGNLTGVSASTYEVNTYYYTLATTGAAFAQQLYYLSTPTAGSAIDITMRIYTMTVKLS